VCVQARTHTHKTHTILANTIIIGYLVPFSFPLLKNSFFLSSFTINNVFHKFPWYYLVSNHIWMHSTKNRESTGSSFFLTLLYPPHKNNKKVKYKCSNIGVNMFSSSSGCNVRSSEANFDLLWTHYYNIF